MSYEFVRLKGDTPIAEFFDRINDCVTYAIYDDIIIGINNEFLGYINRSELIKAKEAFDALKVPPLPENIYTSEIDPGQHYRYEYKGIKLDPARIASIYGMTDHMEFSILKKVLRMGKSLKDKRRELKEIINAAQRKLEMMDEDES